MMLKIPKGLSRGVPGTFFLVLFLCVSARLKRCCDHTLPCSDPATPRLHRPSCFPSRCSTHTVRSACCNACFSVAARLTKKHPLRVDCDGAQQVPSFCSDLHTHLLTLADIDPASVVTSVQSTATEAVAQPGGGGPFDFLAKTFETGLTVRARSCVAKRSAASVQLSRMNVCGAIHCISTSRRSTVDWRSSTSRIRTDSRLSFSPS